MLYSRNKCDKDDNRPIIAAWFGNFFEPYFSNQQAGLAGLQELKELGFNNIVLDSKLWSDFSEYFKTGQESQYVGMQKFLIERCRRLGLGVTFLALYYIGDNLYPDFYDHPPEFVNQPVVLHGEKIRGYRHWDPAQRREHVLHCMNLYSKMAGDTAATAKDENGQEKIPFYFYHDPLFSPSFDEEGRKIYLNWLKKHYSPDELTNRYGFTVTSIDNLTPQQYWVYPEEAGRRWDVPQAKDYQQKNENVLKYADNQRFKMELMGDYFTKISHELKEQESRFYLYSSISQWKYFLNDCEKAWYWDASRRGVDLWKLGESLDSPSFTAVPVDCYSEPSVYSVSCELAMLRSAAQWKDFVAGLFLGRYLYRDAYAVCSPAEIIATAFGAGATDLYFYGYNGLDDGGNFGKWEPEKKHSLKLGLDFFSKVRKMSGKRTRDRKAAILFPQATFAVQHAGYDWKEYAARRQDLLGWYQQMADLGIACDILHPDQIRTGELEDYLILICPANPMEWAWSETSVGETVCQYVQNGGTVLRSASAGLEDNLNITSKEHEFDSIRWKEDIVIGSPEFRSLHGGQSLAEYIQSGESAFMLHRHGKGAIYSFGFEYGYAYACVEHLPARTEYGKQNHYPLTMLDRTPVEDILLEKEYIETRQRNIERIHFEMGELVINHSPIPVEVQAQQEYISTFAGFDGRYLPSHEAVFLLDS